jgi:tetratricopeptide (TPR) repeat protein
LFDKTNDRFAMSALLEALARYYAQIGQLEIAEKCWQRSATIEDSARNAMTRLVEIKAVRGWLYVAAGLRQIQEFRKSGVDVNAIILPRNRGGLLNEAERHLKRYQRALEKIVPADELWRFGVNSILD